MEVLFSKVTNERGEAALRKEKNKAFVWVALSSISHKDIRMQMSNWELDPRI